MGSLPFLFLVESPERKKERDLRRDGGARSQLSYPRPVAAAAAAWKALEREQVRIFN